MTKIIRNKNLPKEINVVINGKIIAKAVFNDEDVYETNDKDVIRELKEYGYKVEEAGRKIESEELEEIEKPRTRRNRGIE